MKTIVINFKGAPCLVVDKSVQKIVVIRGVEQFEFTFPTPEREEKGATPVSIDNRASLDAALMSHLKP